MKTHKSHNILIFCFLTVIFFNQSYSQKGKITIIKDDKIFVLKQGKIVERGNHAELMQKNGHYANLVQMH